MAVLMLSKNKRAWLLQSVDLPKLSLLISSEAHLAVFSPLNKDLIELSCFSFVFWIKAPGSNSPAFFREGGGLHLRNLFLVQLPALCHASKKVFRMNKYSGQIQALFIMVISKEAVVSFQELRSPLCALENTKFSLSLISIFPLMAQNGRHPKARGHVS